MPELFDAACGGGGGSGGGAEAAAGATASTAPRRGGALLACLADILSAPPAPASGGGSGGAGGAPGAAVAAHRLKLQVVRLLSATVACHRAAAFAWFRSGSGGSSDGSGAGIGGAGADGGGNTSRPAGLCPRLVVLLDTLGRDQLRLERTQHRRWDGGARRVRQHADDCRDVFALLRALISERGGLLGELHRTGSTHCFRSLLLHLERGCVISTTAAPYRCIVGG